MSAFITFSDFLVEVNRPGKPYHGSKIIVFDLDDTLVITSAKIRVFDPISDRGYELTPAEFNFYQKNPNHTLDFSDFSSLEIMKGGMLIQRYLDQLKRAYMNGIAVGIVTARADQKMIHSWMKDHVGFRIDPELIFAINDPSLSFTGSISDRKQQAFQRYIEMGYQDFTFLDDDRNNLKLVKQLEKKYSNIKIRTHLAKTI